MTKKVKRRYVTLIEMMIVMFLIAMIIGVIAYNYQGSLDEGKAFKTKTGIEKVKTILMLRLAENGGDAQNINNEWKRYVRESPLVQNPNALLKDGWGDEYQVQGKEVDGDLVVEVTSKKYENYKKKKGTLFGEDKEER